MLTVNQATSETITLNTIVGSERMVLEVVDTPSPLMSMARQGQHMPLLLGASSRIMMAFMETKELDAVLKANTIGSAGKLRVRHSFGTSESDRLFDRAAFDRELARFRRQGYAISRGQRVTGLTAISAPITDMEGKVRHCLSLTGPSVRIDPRDLEFAEILVNAGRDLSNRLGASPQGLADLKHAAEHELGVQAASSARRKKTAASEKAAARLVA
jgi:IclR family transcriptional regulator, KDG regulon repressor